MLINKALESSQFHGLTGDILDVTSVRGSVVANLMHHLTFFGTSLGCYPHVEWRGKIYADLNCVLVGTSGCGKGESLEIIKELYTFPTAQQELLAPPRNTSFTSGKRTIQAIHAILGELEDGETRFLSIEEECSSQIKGASQGNNTLTQTLIKLIDGNAVTDTCYGRSLSIRPLHFGSVGHITPMELIAALPQRAFFNGLGNRFLFMGIPTPELSEDEGRYVEADMISIRGRLIMSLREGGARKRVDMDEGAREVYVNLLRSLRADTSSERLLALQQRMHIICLKLALTLALVNREATITRQTMEEACAIIDYSRQTIGRLFGTTEEETPEQVILNYLAQHGRTQRTPLMQGLSSRLPRKVLDAALTNLIRRKQVLCTTETIPHGRTPHFYELASPVQAA